MFSSKFCFKLEQWVSKSAVRSPVLGRRLRGGHSSQLWVHSLIFSCKILFEAKGLGQKECLIISMLDNSTVNISKNYVVTFLLISTLLSQAEEDCVSCQTPGKLEVCYSYHAAPGHFATVM